MEKLHDKKFCELSNKEMQNITGGDIWGRWKEVGRKQFWVVCNGVEITQTAITTQYYDWFGLHATSTTSTSIISD